MRLLIVIVVLVLGLAAQTGLGALWPQWPRYVDIMLVPVVWYAMAGSQRTGMLVGCVAGLLQDTWFQTGVFGINGFKKTAIGWMLGGVGARFDVNRQPGRFAFGVMASLTDTLIDLGLRRLLDQPAAPPATVEILLRALIAGIMVTGAFAAVRRIEQRKTRYRT